MAEATQETQCLPANGSLERPIHRFNSANAAEMARKAHESRIKRQNSEKEALALAKQQTALAQPLIQAAVAHAVALTLEPEEEYRLKRLQRTREQLEQLDKDLVAANDERATKAICDAIARLSEVESNLAMRPKPGSHRPSRPKSNRSDAGTSGPID